MVRQDGISVAQRLGSAIMVFHADVGTHQCLACARIGLGQKTSHPAIFQHPRKSGYSQIILAARCRHQAGMKITDYGHPVWAGYFIDRCKRRRQVTTAEKRPALDDTGSQIVEICAFQAFQRLRHLRPRPFAQSLDCQHGFRQVFRIAATLDFASQHHRIANLAIGHQRHEQIAFQVQVVRVQRKRPPVKGNRCHIVIVRSRDTRCQIATRKGGGVDGFFQLRIGLSRCPGQGKAEYAQPGAKQNSQVLHMVSSEIGWSGINCSIASRGGTANIDSNQTRHEPFTEP